jgi:hypothetical protein
MAAVGVVIMVVVAFTAAAIADPIRIFIFAGINPQQKKRPPFLEAVCF